jgi:hypothetical protein
MENFEEDIDFTRSDDALVWAKAFIEIVRNDPSLLTDTKDAEGFMLGWFANAMMRGADSKTGRIQRKIDAHNREIRAMSYYISHHCHRNTIPTMYLSTKQEIEMERLLSADRDMLGFIREHMVRLESDDIVGTGQL